jgi:hypothetical protein
MVMANGPAPTEVTEGHSVLKGVLNDLWSNLAEPCDLGMTDPNTTRTDLRLLFVANMEILARGLGEIF